MSAQVPGRSLVPAPRLSQAPPSGDTSPATGPISDFFPSDQEGAGAASRRSRHRVVLLEGLSVPDGTPSWVADLVAEATRSSDRLDWLAAVGLIARFAPERDASRPVRRASQERLSRLSIDEVAELESDAHREVLALSQDIDLALSGAAASREAIPLGTAQQLVERRDRLESVQFALWLASSGRVVARLLSGLDERVTEQLDGFGSREAWSSDRFDAISWMQPDAWWGSSP